MRSGEPGLIEIGVIVTGALDRPDSLAASQAIAQTREYLSNQYPQFRFEFPTIRRPEFATEQRVEPSRLLQQAVEDRNARGWDFAFVLTGGELVGNYSPYCFAALSRPTDAAVFSLSLIDPNVIDTGDEDFNQRVERIASRLSRLMLHALGHLTGLAPSDQPDNMMYRPATAAQLDRMQQLDGEQQERQQSTLCEVADQRLEESNAKSLYYPVFAMRAAWINRRDILEAIWAARPWELPGRLSGLSIASVSTLVILLMTAEAWDLGLAQSPRLIAVLMLLSLVVTTIYVTARQQLLIRRGRQRSEQTVVMSFSALGIVTVGMLVTWLGLAAIGMCVGTALFSQALISSWASSAGWSDDASRIEAIAQMSFFCASLGLIIGSLGASFESKNYFRHVIFVDEEI